MISPSPTARFLEDAIVMSPLSQKEICDRACLTHPNALSMMKSGVMKVPLERIPAIAITCGVDPAEFIRIAMQEYQPKVWGVVSRTLGTFASSDEQNLLVAFRTARREQEIKITKPVSEMLLKLFTVIGEAQGSKKSG